MGINRDLPHRSWRVTDNNAQVVLTLWTGGLSDAKVKKAIKELGIKPEVKKGVCNYYSLNALAKVKAGLKNGWYHSTRPPETLTPSRRCAKHSHSACFRSEKRESVYRPHIAKLVVKVAQS